MNKKQLNSAVLILISLILLQGFSSCKKNSNNEVTPTESNSGGGGNSDTTGTGDHNSEPPKDILSYNSPGQYIDGTEQSIPNSGTFTSNDTLYAAYFFYWFNSSTDSHMDNMINHPDFSNISYESVDWFKQQLEDMIDAGINVILPVYWGDSTSKDWSVVGLKNLVEAWQDLDQSGKTPPKIGMMYATQALQKEDVLKEGGDKPDLTEKKGKDLFYKFIKDFFSLIPPEARARMNKSPMIWINKADYVGAYGQGTFQFLADHFSDDFGGKAPYIASEKSWSNVVVDDQFEYGVSQNGLSTLSSSAIITIGPKKDRNDSSFYIESWKQAKEEIFSDNEKHIIVIESWNDFESGTDIANSQEYGMTYIDITSNFISKIKNGVVAEVYATFDPNGENGIEIVSRSDGKYLPVEIDGVIYGKPDPSASARWLYLKISDTFKAKKESEEHYRVNIVYLDVPGAGQDLVYDSNDPNGGPVDGAYTTYHPQGGGPIILTQGTNELRTASADLFNARFENRQNGDADMRILSHNGNSRIRKVSVQIIK